MRPGSFSCFPAGRPAPWYGRPLDQVVRQACRRLRLRLAAVWVAGLGLSLWAGGDEVVLVYNTAFGPDSRLVAEHYAQRRQVPTNQIIGIDLPRGETMTRKEFSSRLQQPLFEAIEQRGLITFHAEIVPATATLPGRVIRTPTGARVRYLTLCYGIPARILEDAKPIGTNKTVAPTQRREAAVDNELALLPLLDRSPPLEGGLANPLRGTDDLSRLHPTNGLLMVARLDGLSGSLARNLVDSALLAEVNGLWGRAFFDRRGITNGGYKLGDDWIGAAAAVARRHGFETVVDERPATFGTGFPLPQVALYAGWYDQAPSGPFRSRTVEFVPGAIAYHLYSFSARTIRSTNTWVGCLLDAGATATVGFVAEPYLEATLNLEVWFSRLIESGATFAEAAYAALPFLSWQATVIGDPLYRPFMSAADGLSRPASSLPTTLVPWNRLREANLRLARGDSAATVAADLARDPATASSALLEEKAGDLHASAGQRSPSVAAYRRALTLDPTPQQQVRLRLGLARRLTEWAEARDAADAYAQFFREHPTYPDLLGVYRQALSLARKLNDERLIRQYEAEIQRLSRSAVTTNAPSASPGNATATPAKPQ